MSEALKPCPFCGGEAEIRNEDVEPQGDPWYSKTMCLHVRCKTCGCAMFDETFHESFYNESDTMAAWNARAATPDLLAAAKLAIDECCDLIGTPAGDALIAAIARATGKGE